MIKLENVETFGWEAAIRGMRNPMNSWEKSDSHSCGTCGDCSICIDYGNCPYGYDYLKTIVGPNDLDLMKRLRNSGTDHRKFMRMITVYVDITAPLYWWKELDTYKVGTVANSCSTMHKIQAKKFTIDDFSHEHLQEPMLEVLKHTMHGLNDAREAYLSSKDKLMWYQMIQLLPSSYNQKRTVMLNYEVLANIYKSRKNHKLYEWRGFCEWIETLPYSEIITGEREE